MGWLLRLIAASSAVAAACSTFSSSSDAPTDAGADAVPPAPPPPPAPADAGGDDAADAAHAVPCATQSPVAFFCADFDDPADAGVVYERGVRVDLPPVAGNVSVERRPEATSPPNALWINGSGDSYSLTDAPTSGDLARVVTATFSVRFARYSTGHPTAEILSLGTKNPQNCVVALRVDATAAPLLFMNGHCGSPDQNTYQQVMPMLPSSSAFVRIQLTVDTTAGTATTLVDGANPVTLDLQAKLTAPSTPIVSFGVSGFSGVTTGTPEVAFDDVVVTTQ